MSSSLSVFLRRASRLKLTFFAYGVTDESFAVNYTRFQEGGWDINSALTVNQLPNATWFFSTVLGGIGGRFIPEGAFGIDYALYAMFICLLVFQLRGKRYVFTAVIAGAAAIGISMVIPGNWYIVLASVIAATLGVTLSKKIGKV
jgi:predicted branched-subunit amino acid permease